MFLEHQISILKWFLKDHVTLKTGVSAAITEINYILTYCILKYCTFNQVNVALVNIEDFQQHLKTLTDPMCVCMCDLIIYFFNIPLLFLTYPLLAEKQKALLKS